MRLNKYLSDVGVCSRREADRLIEEKRVLVDGKPAVQGMQVRRLSGNQSRWESYKAGRKKSAFGFS